MRDISAEIYAKLCSGIWKVTTFANLPPLMIDIIVNKISAINLHAVNSV
jgi:hypothetical protein